MMDNFREECVSKQKSFLDNLTYIFANIVWVMLFILAVSSMYGIVGMNEQGQMAVDWFSVIIMVVSGGIALLTFLNKDKIKMEYEYTFTNGQMDFAQVYNNKKRKPLGTMNVRNVEACGLVSSGSFQRYINMPDVKRTNWFLNREANLFYFFFKKEDQKRIIIIEPSEEMVGLIKKYINPGVWQNN
ncbi:MAG: hypothetical protein IJO67_10530 [Clostridia bacterium]|nr:hypothetical protein [Clostridia bacterium]